MQTQIHAIKPVAITVIVVNFNAGALILKCLAALRLQTYQPAKIIVVDNASSDGSLAAVEREFPECLFLAQQKNLGFAVANNLAIQAAETEFVALLNPDAFPEPDWLECLYKNALLFPNVAAFGSRQLVQQQPELLDGIGDSYHFSGLAWREGFGQNSTKLDLSNREIFAACAAAVLYRRQAVLDLGGFDEDFFCYFEDVELGFRLRLAGFGCRFVNEAIVHHVGSATTGGQRSDFSVYHGHRNLVWAYIKNMPGWLFWAALPLHLLLNVLTILVFAYRGQGKIILQAKRDALKQLPTMWQKRQEIQKTRVAATADIWRIMNKRPFTMLGYNKKP